MAYQTYITEAVVCGVRESNTSDRVYLLFTRDAGMVFAHAKSVREEKSKHRYALQSFSRIRVTLVRGKAGWRITGTEPLENFYNNATSRESRAFYRRVVLFVRRVMQGETVHHTIFDDVVTVFTGLDKYNLKTTEQVLALRILHTLGYVAPKPEYQELLRNSISPDLVDSLPKNQEEKCRSVVEYALVQSQL